MKAIQRIPKNQRLAVDAAAKKSARKWLLIEAERINTYMDAAVLYALHDVFGFGAVRLKRFFIRFEEVHRQFIDAFSSEEDADRTSSEIREDMAAYYLSELKKIGVDVAAWRSDSDPKDF